MSLVLRHDPSKAGLALDANGWVEVETLLQGLRPLFPAINRDALLEIVRSSDKQRFALSDDGHRIRANQGHSVSVDLQLTEATPPLLLYHGTVAASIADIRREGLQKRKRHHVHLSADLVTAAKVGARRGAPLILTIRAGEMSNAGIPFYLSENGVWLTDGVPPQFITFPI